MFTPNEGKERFWRKDVKEKKKMLLKHKKLLCVHEKT